MIRALVTSLVLIIGMVVQPSLAVEDGSVTMRAAQRDDGGRLLIEWSDPIRVLKKKEGNRLILRFSRPLTADVRPALDRLGPYLAIDQTTVDGTDLTLTLRSGVETELQVKKQRVVIIDLTSTKPAEPHVKLTVSTLESGMRIALEWPEPVGVSSGEDQAILSLTAPSEVGIRPSDLDYLNQTFQPWFTNVQQLQKPGETSLAFRLKPMIVSSVRQTNASSVEIDLLRDASSATAKVKVASGRTIEQELPTQPVKPSTESWPPMPAKRPAMTEPTASDQIPPEAEVAQEQSASAESLVFDWKDEVGAVVFRRAGYLWAVFDAPRERATSPLPPPTLASLGPGEALEADQATIIRFPIIDEIVFRVRRDESGRWLIEPADDPIAPGSIPISSTGAEGLLRAVAPSNGRIITVTDPLVGDQLGLWPVQRAGMGQATRRRFVDLEIQESIQGLVWRSLSDDLTAIADVDGVEFGSGRGLALSNGSKDDADPGEIAALDTAGVSAARSDPDDQPTWVPSPRPETEAKPAAVEREPDQETGEAQLSQDVPTIDSVPDSYLDLAGINLDRNLVTETRRVLRQAIRRSAPERRDQMRLDLVRILVAERIASEADIILQTMSDQLDQPLALSKQALSGAAALLDGDIERASTLLNASNLDQDREIALWRSALHALDRDWEKAAPGWKDGHNSLDIYPPRLRLELGLLALETAIETNDDNQIRRGFRRLRKLELDPHELAQIDRMHALKAIRDGDLKRAEELLKSLAESRYPIISKVADFELASLMQDQNPDDASLLASLHDRLPLWRGHPREISMIDSLATRYRDAERPRPALALWDRLSTIHPKTDDDQAIKNQRRSTYVDALTGLAGQQIGLFDAYAIYLDFIDLMPGDPDDRLVLRHLARHLAGLDLLDEAVSVLQPLLDNTVDQAEAAEIGVVIAERLLLLDRLDEALAVLDRTKVRGEALLDGSERKILRARILARLNRQDEALAEIRDLQSGPARRVRAEIFWRQQNWTRLADVIETILRDPGLTLPLGDHDQKLVLWLALARDKLGQAVELSDLRRRYAAEMASGPWSEAFAIGTQTEELRNDIASLLKHTEDQLQELRRFRENISPDG